MRIDLPRRRRRASLSLEAIMLIPVVMIVILTSRYIAEGMLTRQEVAVYTRASTMSAATSSLPRILSCTADRSEIDARPGVLQTVGADLHLPPGRTRPATRATLLRGAPDGARPSLGILRDIDRNQRITDVKGTAPEASFWTNPSFLTQQGAVTSRQVYLMPEMKLLRSPDAALFERPRPGHLAGTEPARHRPALPARVPGGEAIHGPYPAPRRPGVARSPLPGRRLRRSRLPQLYPHA
jgi:hypothetical protein